MEFRRTEKELRGNLTSIRYMTKDMSQKSPNTKVLKEEYVNYTYSVITNVRSIHTIQKVAILYILKIGISISYRLVL